MASKQKISHNTIQHITKTTVKQSSQYFIIEVYTYIGSRISLNLMIIPQFNMS